MRKFALLLMLLLATAVAVGAQADDVRVFEPLDRSLNYRFTYPLSTHSVRTGNLFEPASAEPVVFGGLIAVEPNDSYIYAGPDVPANRATQMRVLAIPMAEAPASLTALVGTLPLWDADSFDGEIQDITLGGQPAVRLDDASRHATEIVAYYEGALYEIVIDTKPLYLGFRLPDGVSYDAVYDRILASWEFAQLAQ